MSVPGLLNNGVEIPQVGFGVWRVPRDRDAAAVATALEAGYRHVDTAKLYGNEAGVGAAVRESGLDRDAVFVTSKVWNDDQGYDATLRAFDASMDRLGFEVLDLYLIHWPVPEKGHRRGHLACAWSGSTSTAGSGPSGSPTSSPTTCAGCWTAPRSCPAVNQVELHPYLQQARRPPRRRRAGHRHRGVEPDRQGRRPARRPGRHRGWPTSTGVPRPRWCCAGTCSWARS